MKFVEVWEFYKRSPKYEKTNEKKRATNKKKKQSFRVVQK